MQIRLLFILFIIYPFCIINAQFSQPLSTDRPDQTEEPDVVPHKHFQIETGIKLQKDNPVEDVSITTNNFATTLLRYGVIEGIELRLSGAYLQEQTQYAGFAENNSGLEGFNLGAKFHLVEENGIIPQSGLIVSALIPIGEKYFTGEKFVPGFTFAASNTILDWISISYNLGANYRTDQNSLFRYSLASGFQPLKKIGLFAEIFGIIKKTSTPAHAIDFGMTYLVIKNLQLDTSYGLSISDITADSFFSFGLSWRIPK